MDISKPVVLAATTTGLSTGRHRYAVTVTTKTSGGTTLFAGSDNYIRYVVNSDDVTNGNAYGGDGWTLALTDRLVDVAADSYGPAGKLLWSGQGSFRFFAYQGAGLWTNDGPDRGKIALVGSDYVYTTPLGVHEVFNASGYETAWVSADGAKTVTFTYDGSNLLQTAKWYDGSLSTFTYASSKLTGIATRYAPATDSGLGSTTSGQLTTYTLGYSSGRLTSLQAPDSRTWTFTYNGSGQLVEAKVGSAASSGLSVNSYRYSSFGLLSQVRWGNFDSDTSGLNVHSYVPQWSRGLGSYYNATPDATVTDPLNHTTTYQFDRRAFLVRQQNPDGGLFTYTRDAKTSDLLTYSETGPSSVLTTSYSYDADSGFVTRVDYPDGTSERYSYTTLTASNGVYGIDRHVLASYTSDVGAQTLYSYDAVGHPAVITEDPAGINAVTTLTWSVEGAGATTNPGTAAYGNLTNVQDARGNLTSMAYDTYGRLLTQADAVGTYTYDYDDKGNLGREKDRRNVPTTYTYDALHRLLTVARPDPDGTGGLSQWLGTLAYDDAGQLESFTEPLSSSTTRTTTYSYDSRGLSTGETELSYNGTTTVTLRQTTLAYDAAGRLTGSTDPRGNTTQYAYDNTDRLTTLTYAASLGTVTATYAPNHWLTSVTDARGYVTDYAYTGRGWLQSATERGESGSGDDQTTSYLYVFDQTGRQLKVGVTDPRNNTATYVYDALDRLTSTTTPDPDGGGSLAPILTTYTYDKLGNLTQIEHPRIVSGSTHLLSTFTYDAVNRLVDQTVAANTTAEKRQTTYSYDAADRLTSMTDAANDGALARTTTYSYDDLDRLTGVTEASGTGLARTTTYAYDAASRLVDTTFVANSVTYARQTTYAYDALDRLTGVTEAAGTALARLVTYGYDANGNLTSATDPVGRLTSYAYDAIDRLTQVTQPDPDGGGALTSPVTTYAYDGNGNVTGMTDARAHATQYAYDGFNRLTLVTAPDPDAGGPLAAPVTTYGYDKAGNLLTVTDPLSHTTTYNYDNLNRVISVVRPDPDGAGGAGSSVVQYDYQQEGTLLRLIESPGLGIANTYTYDYDHLGRVKTETTTVALDASTTVSATRTYSYDTLGRLQSKVDRDGRLVTYTYDALDRLTNERWYAGPTTTSTLDRNTTYTYDLRDNLLDADQGTGQPRTTFVYDVLDRVADTTTSTPVSGRVLSTTYSYAADGQVLARTILNSHNPDSRTTYTYDGIGRLQSVHLEDVNFASGKMQATFTYLPTGEVETVQRAGGASLTAAALTTYSYDDLGRTTSVATAQGTYSYLYSYAYDAASRITREDTPAGAVTYTYYADDQLAGADYNYRIDETFTWDENGNPTGTGIVIGAGDRLISDGATTYQYDAEGNRTRQDAGSTVTTYVWDQRDRLTGATRSVSGTATMVTTQTYDPFNRRIDDVADPDGAGPLAAVSDTYYWDGDQVQARRRGATSSVIDHFLLGPGTDNVLADEKQGAVHWTVTDVRGSVSEVLDGNGASETRKDYSGFGQKTDSGNPSVVDTVFAYTGREYDPELGLQYNRNRWYDPVAKRFVSEDYLRSDVNASRYSKDEPTDLTDPYGLFAVLLQIRIRPRNSVEAANLTSSLNPDPLSSDDDDDDKLEKERKRMQTPAYTQYQTTLSTLPDLSEADLVIATEDPHAAEIEKGGKKYNIGKFCKEIGIYRYNSRTAEDENVRSPFSGSAASAEELLNLLRAAKKAGMVYKRIFLIGHMGGQNEKNTGVWFGTQKNPYVVRIDIAFLKSKQGQELIDLLESLLDKNGEIIFGACGYSADNIQKSLDAIAIRFKRSGITLTAWNVKGSPHPNKVFGPGSPSSAGDTKERLTYPPEGPKRIQSVTPGKT